MNSDAEFQLLTLGELGDFKNGANFSQGDYGAGYPIVNVKQLYGGRYIDLHGLESLGKEVLKRPEQLFLEEGDILFARSSVKRSGAGQCALVPSGVVQTIFSGFIIRYRLSNKETTSPMYLAYLLQSPIYREIFPRIATGTTISNLSQDALKQVQVQLPKKQIQDEVAAIIGTLDDRITLLRETNATLEAIAQAMFKSWFVDFDPVRAKAEGRQPEGMDAPTAALFPDSFEESELGLVPKGWRWAALADAYEMNPARKLKKGEVAPYLDMSSAPTSGHCSEAYVQREMGSGAKFTNGDTLLARITPCLENGKSAFVDFLDDGQNGWGSTEFIVLRPKAPLPEYHGYLLARHTQFRDFAVQCMSGTSGRQRIQNDMLGRFLLALPTESVANAFSDFVMPIQKSITANHKQAQTLGLLRDTLLPRLISGQLRLPDAEHAAEEALA